MATQRLGIIMHGITGRMGYNQHLVRSICAIRDQGGVALANGDRVMPDPVLIGRNAEKVQAIAAKHFYRPYRPEAAAAEDIARFGQLNLVTIEDFGGWREAQPKYFGDGGVFDQIYTGPTQ